MSSDIVNGVERSTRERSRIDTIQGCARIAYRHGRRATRAPGSGEVAERKVQEAVRGDRRLTVERLGARGVTKTAVHVPE